MNSGHCYLVVVVADDTGLHVEVVVHDSDNNHGMNRIGGPNR